MRGLRPSQTLPGIPPGKREKPQRRNAARPALRGADSEKSGFEFLRVVNDVPVYDNGAWISFDEKTGELTAFTLNWTAVDFPDTANAAAQDKADEAAMKKGELSLYYVAGTTEKPEDTPQKKDNKK